ncbi:DUF3500 domain-containing protein [bacterium]|nr:MAG: DUF3500 domain-containing protein [bacterium]
MNKLIVLPLCAFVGTLSLGFIVASVSCAQQTVPQQTKPVALAPVLAAAKNTDSVVDAANAFLATLSKEQQGTAQVELKAGLAAKWSNFPAAVVPRNGVFFRNLNAAQVAVALKVAKLALSEEGFKRFQEIRATDDAFGKSDEAKRGPGGGRGGGPNGGPPGGFGGPPNGFGGPGGGGPGAPGGLFGTGNYIIAFLGTPSKTTPWLLQLGGHHLAFNIYYKGTEGTSTPYFVGAQPNVWKDDAGVTHAPLAPMRDGVHELVNSLTVAQLKTAKLDANFSDVYVGPGRDGQFPAQQGVAVSELSDKSKQLVKQAIAAWTGDSVQGAEYRKLYDAELDKTKVAYSGSTNISDEGDYVRIDGPHVWIEFACQASNHYHTIWRDRKTDYGAEFSFEAPKNEIF